MITSFDIGHVKFSPLKPEGHSVLHTNVLRHYYKEQLLIASIGSNCCVW